MKKWVKDQARGQLIELKDNVTIWSEIDEDDKYKKELYSWLECNKFVLGSYSTFNRCQEILNNIEMFISSKEESIFVMPKE